MSASLPLIVVVDDSLVVRAMLARQLDDHGYQVVEATDGESALEICSAQPPDAVLLDLNLPGISGYEVLAALRADAATADIPVIILTERQSAEDAARGLELGAHDYLRKPIYPVELIARVDAALRLRNAEAVLRKRNTQLELANRTDFLSGLANRRHMDELLGRACVDARRDKRPLGLLIVDVDHFKDINDMVGHVAGDAVLREIGRRSAAIMRAEDTAGRWGGDEFLFLMPNTDAAQLALAGERLRLAASHAAVPIGIDRDLVVTVTVGGAVFAGADVDDFVRAADAALYDAKNNGRDAVVIAGPDGAAQFDGSDFNRVAPAATSAASRS